MRFRSIDRLVLVGSASLMPVLSAAQGASVVDGYRYTIVGTQTGGGIPGRADGTQAMEVRGLVADGVQRMEYPTGPAPFGRPGVYTLVNARTGELVLVDSVARKSVAMNSPSMLGATGSSAIQMTVSDTASKLEELGPGDVVLGYATRKVRLTIRYAISFGDVAESKTSTVQIMTMHISDAVNALDPGFAMMTPGAMTPAGQAPQSELEKSVLEMSRKLPKGFALVAEQDVRITSPMMELASASRMRVTELMPVKVSTATLSLPAGLTKVDYLSYVMAAMQAPP